MQSIANIFLWSAVVAFVLQQVECGGMFGPSAKVKAYTSGNWRFDKVFSTKKVKFSGNGIDNKLAIKAKNLNTELFYSLDPNTKSSSISLFSKDQNPVFYYSIQLRSSLESKALDQTNYEEKQFLTGQSHLITPTQAFLFIVSNKAIHFEKIDPRAWIRYSPVTSEPMVKVDKIGETLTSFLQENAPDSNVAAYLIYDKTSYIYDVVTKKPKFVSDAWVKLYPPFFSSEEFKQGITRYSTKYVSPVVATVPVETRVDTLTNLRPPARAAHVESVVASTTSHPAIAEPVKPAAAEPVKPAAAEPVKPAAAEPVVPAAVEPVQPALPSAAPATDPVAASDSLISRFLESSWGKVVVALVIVGLIALCIFVGVKLFNRSKQNPSL